jgi:hypothetical protein
MTPDGYLDRLCDHGPHRLVTDLLDSKYANNLTFSYECSFPTKEMIKTLTNTVLMISTGIFNKFQKIYFSRFSIQKMVFQSIC